ncbi:hypothetical protein A3Q56_00767, partial [Intoshia linei]
FPFQKLLSRCLYFQIYDYDRFTRDDVIGEVILPLASIDISGTVILWKKISSAKSSEGKLGSIKISLCYNPKTGIILINVVECKHLKSKDITGSSDPYVKIWLLQENKRICKYKTPIQMRNLNPIYNCKFEIKLTYEQIRKTSIEIIVMDYDRLGRNEKIGQINIGPRSGTLEMQHWNEMISNGRVEITKWHILKKYP